MNYVSQPARFKKVLVIDDNEIDLLYNERIIKSVLFAEEVVRKNSVDSALEYLEGLIHTSGSLPEVIFVNLNMPGKKGFDFLEEINIISSHSEINFRIVVLSSYTDSFKDKAEKAKNYPMVEAVLEKPLNPDALKNI